MMCVILVSLPGIPKIDTEVIKFENSLNNKIRKRTKGIYFFSFILSFIIWSVP